MWQTDGRTLDRCIALTAIRDQCHKRFITRKFLKLPIQLYVDVGSVTRCFRCCRSCRRSVNWLPTASSTWQLVTALSVQSSLSTKICALSPYRYWYINRCHRRYFTISYKGQGGAVALDLRLTGRGFKSYSGQKLRSNLGQAVHTYVTLSPSSITWYRPRGGDALRLGR